MRKRVLFFILALVAPSSAWAQKGVPSTYDEIFRKYSKQYFGVGFDWKVFKAQAMTESNLNPEAKSWAAVISHVSFVELWANALQGMILPRHLIYHLSIAVFWLFATVKVLESRKWS